jgi:hypothetical protein
MKGNSMSDKRDDASPSRLINFKVAVDDSGAITVDLDLCLNEADFAKRKTTTHRMRLLPEQSQKLGLGLSEAAVVARNRNGDRKPH